MTIEQAIAALSLIPLAIGLVVVSARARMRGETQGLTQLTRARSDLADRGPQGGSSSAEGTVDGFPVVIRPPSLLSINLDEARPNTVRVAVDVGLPRRLILGPGRRAEALSTAAQGEALETGDAAFDAAFRIRLGRIADEDPVEAVRRRAASLLLAREDPEGAAERARRAREAVGGLAMTGDRGALALAEREAPEEVPA